MPVKTVTTDIWAYPATIRVNTVNCVGVMGRGIALEFKDRYPRMFIAYAKVCRAGELYPGGIFDWTSPVDGIRILNVATKDHWRDPSQYEWIRTGLQSIKAALLPSQKIEKVALPAMGCSNCGLKFETVREMVFEELDSQMHEIHLFSPV